MEKDRLIERLNYLMGKKDAVALAEQFVCMDNGIAILFELCQSKNNKLGLHSAWVLENALILHPDLLSLSLPKIIELIPTTTNPSAQRHFSKLLNYAMTACSKNLLSKDTCLLLKKVDMEPIVETCFDWLMSPTVKPAVKAHCMDILLFLAKRYEWIEEELPHVIELLMIDGTPGIRSKGKKILASIRNTRN